MRERKYTVASVGGRIDQFLRPLLKTAGFRLDFRVVDGESAHPEVEDPEVVVKLSGPDVDLLLGNKAELLLALEHVTMEALGVPHDHHALLCFDANDYRALRIEELRLSAATAAERVKRTGMPFTFNPMNSRERRVIHLALRGETELRSESSGLGSHRQVVIYPAGMPSPPQPAGGPRDFQGRGRGPRR